MRVPLAIPFDSRQSNTGIDARMANALVEAYEDKHYVTNRPALTKNATETGSANGLVTFDGSLISVFGANIYENYAIPADTWTQVTDPSPATRPFVSYGNGVFFAGGTTIGVPWIYSTDDGVTWNVGTTVAMTPRAGTYGNNIYVAVGTSVAAHSSDGINWTTHSVTAGQWDSVTYGNGLFVAVSWTGSAATAVMTSPDGVTWTNRTGSAGNLWSGVAYGNGVFVAVSLNGTDRVMTSPDGINWTARTAAEQNTWISVTFGNGIFVALSASGTNQIMTSPDGITWTPVAFNCSSGIDICFCNGMFIVAAQSGTNRFFYSTDAINWTGVPMPVNSTVNSVFSNGVDTVVAAASHPDTLFITSSRGPSLIGTVTDDAFDFAQTST